jgi:N-acetylmuramoyl-L-alanine amidase
LRQKVYSFIGAFILAAIFLFPAGAFAEKMVVIDPGHGGRFSGTCGYSGVICEKSVNLAVGQKVKQALQFSGIKVFLTRESDIHFSTDLSTDLGIRMNLANGYVRGNNDNSLFISIHHNASASSSNVKGYETYYYDPALSYETGYPYDPIQATYTKESKRLAETTHPIMVTSLGSLNRGIHSKNLSVVRNAQMPSILVELGYMTNREEESRIRTEAFQQQAAQALAQSIKEFFKAFDVYQNGSRIATFKTLNEAVNYAQAQSGDIRVFDKDAQAIVWGNDNYEVYHKTNGLLKSFANEQEAITFANSNADTRVVEKATGATIWANYFSQRYDVQDAAGNSTKFFDLNKAIESAKGKGTARIVRVDTNEILWTTFPNEQVTKNLQTTRVNGATRYTTSVEISKTLFPAGFDPNGQKTVILTTGVEPADALSSGPLSAIYGNAPILLNQGATLLPEVKTELSRLGAAKVIIIGGTAVIPVNVENEVKALGITTERISGQERLETNLRIVERLGSVEGVFVASSRSWPDALAASSIAVANNWSIVLTNQNEISNEALNYIKGKKVVIVGGPVVVSDQVQNQIVQVNGAQNVIRLAGAERSETLANILWYFKDQMKSDTINIATSANFPDALTAAPLSMKNKAPLVLFRYDLNKNIESFLYQYTEENLINKVNVVGGPDAVSDSLKDTVINKAK